MKYSDSLDSLASSQKSGAGEPAYLRWVNRPLGRRAAAFASTFGATPNQVTAVSGLVSLLGIVLLCTGWVTIAAAVGCSLLLLLGYVLDSADGQLARLTGTGSAAGEWLDHVVDAVRLPGFHVAVAISLSVREGGGEARWPVVVALAFSVLSSVWFFASTLGGKLVPIQAVIGRSESPTWISFVKAPLDIAFLYLVVLLLPAYWIFVSLYVAVFALSVLAAATSMRRRYMLLSATASSGRTERNAR